MTKLTINNVERKETKMEGSVALNITSPKLGVINDDYTVRLLTHLDNKVDIIKRNKLCILGIMSLDARSPYFSEIQQSSSTDKRRLANNTKTEYKFAKANFSQYGQVQTESDKLVYLDKFEAGVETASMISDIISSSMPPQGYKGFLQMSSVELQAYSKQLGFFRPEIDNHELEIKDILVALNKIAIVKEEDIVVKSSYDNRNISFINPTKSVLPIAFGEVVPASVGKTRQGHAQYLFTMADEARSKGYLETMNRVVFLQKLGLKLSAFAKITNDNMVEVALAKMITRIRLDNSSSIATDLFKDRKVVSQHTETLYMDVPVLVNDEYTYDEDGKIISELVPQEVDVLVFDNGMTMKLAPDFIVHQKVETLVTTFSLNGEVSSKTVVKVFPRSATDGAIYMSDEIRKQYFDKAFGKTYGGLQFRAFGYQKGLTVFVPNLRYFFNADIVSFDGSRKADIKEYLKDNDELTFSVLNFTREPKVKEVNRFARQGMTNAFGSKQVVEDAFAMSAEHFNRALEFEKESLKSLLGVDEISSDDEEAYQDMINTLLNSNDSTTTQFLSANLDLALKSGNMKNKANTLISSVMKKFKNGHAYLDDSYTRHMLVDPLAILSYIKKGRIGVIKEKVKQIGISKDSIVDIGKNANGEYYLKEGSSTLTRYPNADVREVRKVSKNKFEENKTKELYERYAKEGYFKGLIIFSLWDMNPEGMSGADYDGDTCLVINTPFLINSFKPKELFLDYSLVENSSGDWELKEGCPFSTPATDVDIYKLIPTNKHHLIEKYQLQIGDKYGDIKFNKLGLENESEFLDLIFPIIQYFILVNLRGNDIGKYTNILTTVTAVKSEVSADINTTRALAKELVELIPLQNSVEVAEELIQDTVEVQEAIEDLVREYEGYENLQIYLTAAVRWEIDAAKHGGAYREHLKFLSSLEGMYNHEQVIDALIASEDRYGVSLQRLFVEREAVVKPSFDEEYDNY